MEIAIVALLLVAIALLVLLLLRKNTEDKVIDAFADIAQEERERAETRDRRLREEMASTQRNASEMLIQQMGQLQRMEQSGMAEHNRRLADFSRDEETRLERFRQTLEGRLTQNDASMERIRSMMDARMREMTADNAQRLENMRQTVDEKLSQTLEKRLGESFSLVSQRLEQVYKGLGEMQTLATGVGDLKRVLTNVTTRGAWGEVQLGALLEQILTPSQYEANVAVRPGARERVEFALKMPAQDQSGIYLPIDAKFPQEDYQRLIDAQQSGDMIAAAQAAKALEATIRVEAKRIQEKYVQPPYTTDFALLFLPVEGLYAEVLRRPGLVDSLQRERRVVVAGPTTLMALLNALQMGFRTLAIEKRSSEVWQLLGAVKTEFGKFATLLEKTKKKLDEASATIDNATKNTKRIESKLRDVQQLQEDEAQTLLPDEPNDSEDYLVL